MRFFMAIFQIGVSPSFCFMLVADHVALDPEKGNYGWNEEIQPKMKKLQEKYKEDKVRMQQELMKLYKDNNVNPLSGCY